MKKGKLLILLLATLSIILVLAACEKTSTLDETTVGTVAGSDSETVSQSTEEVSTEEQLQAHEAHEYFLMGVDFAPVYDEISEIDGELYDIDPANNLLVVITEKIDAENLVNKTASVYDLVSGEVILKTDVTYPENPTLEDSVELDITLDYPIIRVSKQSYGENGFAKYDVEYYFAHKDGELIKSTDKSAYERIDYDNGLVCFVMGDESVWIDKNMNVVRRDGAIATDGFAPEEFYCEYMGYLYSWTDTTLQIFNRDGVCSGTYEITHDGFIKNHVLDSGDVLIQELEPVDRYTTADVTINGERFVVKSYVMKYLDGAMEEVELDFIVDEIATAYGSSSHSFPFALAQGHDNQVYVYKFANGNLSPFVEYAVMSNDLEIEYVLKNDTHGITYDDAYAVDSHHYIAYAPLAHSIQAYLFDLDGNGVPVSSTQYFDVTSKYIVTATGIFDHKLNKLYDFDGNGFYAGYVGVDIYYDKVYMSKYNAVTGAVEDYVFDAENNQPIMMANGVEKSLYVGGGGYHVMIDIDTNKYSFINSDGTTVFVTYGEPDIIECNGLLVALTEFEGNRVIYVIK